MSENSNHWDYAANAHNANANNSASNGGYGSVEHSTHLNNAAYAQTMANLERDAQKIPLHTPVEYTNPFATNTTQQTYYSSGYSGKTKNSSILNASTIIFLIFSGLSYFIFDATLQGHQVFSDEIEPVHFLNEGFKTTKSNEIKRYQSWNIEHIQKNFGTIYKSNTPFEKMYDGCSNPTNCTQISFSSLEKLKPYSISPATYINDICNLDFKSSNNHRNTIDHKWELKPYEYDKRKLVCTTTNLKEVTESANQINIYARNKGVLFATPIFILGLFLTFKKKQSL